MKKILKLILVFGLGYGLVSLFTAVSAPAATTKPQGVPEYISPNDVRAIVENINQKVFRGWFNPADVLAIIEIESSFRPHAERYESKLNDSSIGLMQILMSSAKDRGFTGTKAELIKPSINILYGMKHLKWSYDYLARRKVTVTKDEWISSYNMGVGNTMRGYLSHDYISKFKAARSKY